MIWHKPSRRLIGSGVPKGLILRPKLFNIIINDLDDREESTLNKFADDRKWGWVADRPGGSAVILRDCDRLEKRASGNLIHFSRMQ